MGIVCTCCAGPTLEQTAWQCRKASKKKARPLLHDLEQHFAEFAGDDGLLDGKELAAVLKKCAEKESGRVSDDEAMLIQETAEHYLKVLDLDGNGFVSYDELAAFMLGATETRGPLKDMRSKLASQFRENPEKLQETVKMFRALDKNGDGYLGPDEIAGALKDLAGSEGQGGLLVNLLEEADVDADGRVDLWEVIAHSMGRRRAAVELMLYDITKGAAKVFSKVLLGKKFEAIYHCSILVYGSEWWYGGNVFRSEPPVSEKFGQPLQKSKLGLTPSTYFPNMNVLHLGYTFVTLPEVRQFMVKTLSHKYTPENYDVLTHNCLHFANDVVDFLIGDTIPDEVSKLPEVAMNTPTARVLRPLLNRWLGGFGQSQGTSGEAKGNFDEDMICTETSDNLEDVCQDAFGTGSAVLIEGIEEDAVVGTIVREAGDSVDVKYFDPGQAKFLCKEVRRSLVKAT